MMKDLDYIYTHGIFSDETSNFVKPFDPKSTEPVQVSLRCMKNKVHHAYICTRYARYEMYKMQEDIGVVFDFYAFDFQPSAETLEYYFFIEGEQGNIFYTRYGAFFDVPTDGYFRVFKDYETPEWAQGAVMYQIFPDRFCNGDPDNDVIDDEYVYLERSVKRVRDWDTPPKKNDVGNFYGGDLLGIIQKLDYLKELGVEGIYLNPIFVSPSNHKYDAQDYSHIDPHFGKIIDDCPSSQQINEVYKTRVTSEKNLRASDMIFADLTREAHERGIKVILDGVFNHCGAFHKWLNAAEIYDTPALKDSVHADYFYWHTNEQYEGWWGHDNHPKLNIESCKELEEALYGVAKKWVSAPFHADGWRLDVAADLGKTGDFNHTFWRNFRNAVRSKNPEALILAENYGDSSSWLEGDQWDTIMNYDAFMEPVSWFFTGISKHSTDKRDDLFNNADAFWNTMHYQMGKLPMQARITAMNQLSNHDHSRFLTRTNRKTGRLHTHGTEMAGEDLDFGIMREAVVLQMTWIGMPTLYYGDEAGVVGWTDPDNRRTYPWGKEDKELIAFHKDLIAIRQENKSLRHGSLKGLYGEYGLLGYGRFLEENRCAIAFNNTEEDKTIRLPVWQLGIEESGRMELIFKTDANGYSVDREEYIVVKGFLSITLPPTSSMIFKEK